MTEKKTENRPKTRADVPLTVTLYGKTYLNRLPTAEDGVEGLLAMADLFGDEEFFLFSSLMRAAGGGAAAGGKGGGAGLAGEARTRVANRLVDAQLEKLGPEQGRLARVYVGRKLGYTTTTQANFNKICDGVTRRAKTAKAPLTNDELLELQRRTQEQDANE